MTREEAIEYIKEWMTDEYALNGNDRAALDMAVKALEEDGDCVSRQDVLETLLTMYNTHIIETEDGDEYIDYNDTVYEIENLPSVTPKPETGRWIHPTDDGHNFPEHYCSECGKWEYSDEESNFCANCGRMMVEPQESEDKE